jgi:hypothetical protein
MSTITNLVSLGYLMSGGIGVSGIQGGQPKPRGDRRTLSDRYCAAPASVTAARFEQPKHGVVLVARPTTFALTAVVPTTGVPTTGVPPSAMARRT